MKGLARVGRLGSWEWAGRQAQRAKGASLRHGRAAGHQTSPRQGSVCLRYEILYRRAAPQRPNRKSRCINLHPEDCCIPRFAYYTFCVIVLSVQLQIERPSSYLHPFTCSIHQRSFPALAA